MDLTLTLAAEGGWTPIGYLGDYTDDRYGDFSLTREMVASWAKNLDAGAVTGTPGMLAIDYDHSSQQGVTKAAGWLRELRLDGDRILARIEWTQVGRAAIADGEYKYFSPTFSRSYKDDQGRELGDTLVGGALTNSPFLRSKGALAVALCNRDYEVVVREAGEQAARTLVVRSPRAPQPTADVSAGYRNWALSSGFGGTRTPP